LHIEEHFQTKFELRTMFMVFRWPFFMLRVIISLSAISNLSVLPNTRIVPFQVLSVKRPWQRGSL
jgi:hypothetical protein